MSTSAYVLSDGSRDIIRASILPVSAKHKKLSADGGDNIRPAMLREEAAGERNGGAYSW